MKKTIIVDGIALEKEVYLISGYSVDHNVIMNYLTGEVIPDAPFTVLNLSVRAYNVLHREGSKIKDPSHEVCSISDLLQLDYDELFKFRNLGLKSAQEIITELKKYLDDHENYAFRKQLRQDDDPALNSKYEVTDSGIRDKMTNRIIPDIPIQEINIAPFHIKYLTEAGYTNISRIIRMNFDDFRKETNFSRTTARNICRAVERKLYFRFLSAQINEEQQKKEPPSLRLLQQLNSCSFAGMTSEEAAKALNDLDELKVNELLSSLESEGKVQKKQDRWVAVFPSFFECATEMSGNGRNELNELKLLILQLRSEGETLQTISDKTGITRERVRQLEKKSFKIVTGNRKTLFREDYYAYLYQNYQVPRGFLADYLNEKNSTQYYLTIRYDSGKKEVAEALEDPNIPEEIQTAIRKSLHDEGEVKIRGTDKQMETIATLISTYCQDEMTIDEFGKIYEQYLTEKTPDSKDRKLSAGTINRIITARNVLWKQNQRLRYYNMDGDFSGLFSTLNLGRYQDVELSSRKLFLEHPDLMKEYDIRDEYELHNLLKKLHAETENPTLQFGRMPSLQFGTFDREQAIKKIILMNQPVSQDDLAALLSQEYGFHTNTIKSNWLKEVSKYYHHGIYVCLPEEADEAAVSPGLPAAQTDSGTAVNGKKTAGKALSPREKLFRRIRREFSRKKLLGDISVTDEEFEILVQYLRSQIRYLYAQSELFECDEMLCVTLVQIGIRYYDGKYWPYVVNLIKSPYFKDNHCNMLGNAFLDFMRRNNKILAPEKKAMSNSDSWHH